MIGHDHVRTVHFVERPHDLQHVHVAVVEIDLLKVIAPSTNISKVNVENLFAFPKVANYVMDLFVRILQHFGDRPQAQIEAVIGAVLN